MCRIITKMIHQKLKTILLETKPCLERLTQYYENQSKKESWNPGANRNKMFIECHITFLRIMSFVFVLVVRLNRLSSDKFLSSPVLMRVATPAVWEWHKICAVAESYCTHLYTCRNQEVFLDISI